MSKNNNSKSNGSEKPLLGAAKGKQAVVDKTVARRSRDSSLYRDVQTKADSDDKDVSSQSSQSIGTRNIRFVMIEDPEVVPVNHQAVIEGLTNTLAEIDTKHEQLEALLRSKNSANKLHIAQLKGQIAGLKRRKTEIESVLGANDAQLTADSPASSQKSPKG